MATKIEDSTQTSSVSILLIDDSVLEAELFSNKLSQIEDLDIQFSHLKNPEEAYLTLFSGQYDLTFLDYRFGGSRTGVDLVRELRSWHYDRPIYLLTGYGTQRVKSRSLNEGADGYIEKNVLTPSYLENVLKEVTSVEDAEDHAS